jgi:hypothetical protein
VAKYGCTLCHGSQGYATDMDAAHSVGNANWGEPLLGGELGKFNLISNREALIQVNCNICRTGGASLINRKSLLVGNAKGELCSAASQGPGIDFSPGTRLPSLALRCVCEFRSPSLPHYFASLPLPSASGSHWLSSPRRCVSLQRCWPFF